MDVKAYRGLRTVLGTNPSIRMQWLIEDRQTVTHDLLPLSDQGQRLCLCRNRSCRISAMRGQLLVEMRLSKTLAQRQHCTNSGYSVVATELHMARGSSNVLEKH